MLNKFRYTLAIILLVFAQNCLAADNTDSQKSQLPNQKAPLRIIALAPHIVEMLFEIGAGSYIVATTAHADYPAEARHIPQVGNYAKINIEAVLAYQPDLIIGWKTGNPSDDLARLAELGLNIVYSDPQQLDDVAKELRYFGSLVNHQAQADIKATQFEQDVNAIRQQYMNKPVINVFYELWPNPLTTIANNAWPLQAIKVCGADTVFNDIKGDYPQINLEQVIVKKPDAIVIPVSDTQQRLSEVNWKNYSDIPAVKNNFFVYPNADEIHRMSMRFVKELDLLCQGLAQIRQQIYKH